MPGPDLLPQLRTWADQAGAQTSTSRRRQLRWVAGELARYAAQAPTPVTALDLLTAKHAQDYLDAASAGMLRARDRHHVDSPASTRVRIACLRILATTAGVRPPDLTLPPAAPATDPLPARTTWEAASALRDRSLSGRRLAAAARAALVFALVADTSMRVGELAALEVDDLDLDARTVKYTPRPQAARAPREPVTAAISVGTVAAARVWLAERERLTTMTPRSRALFVSVRGNHSGAGATRPPGLPVLPRGLVRAHRKAAATLNGQQATRELVPSRLGQLRPAITTTSRSQAEEATLAG